VFSRHRLLGAQTTEPRADSPYRALAHPTTFSAQDKGTDLGRRQGRTHLPTVVCTKSGCLSVEFKQTSPVHFPNTYRHGRTSTRRIISDNRYTAEQGPTLLGWTSESRANGNAALDTRVRSKPTHGKVRGWAYLSSLPTRLEWDHFRRFDVSARIVVSWDYSHPLWEHWVAWEIRPLKRESTYQPEKKNTAID
jgi:hypothetical protein